MGWLDILKALPMILRLFQSVADYATLQQGKGIGRAEAINEGLTRASDDLERASAAIREAEQKHVADPTDTAFDDQFKRPS